MEIKFACMGYISNGPISLKELILSTSPSKSIFSVSFIFTLKAFIQTAMQVYLVFVVDYFEVDLLEAEFVAEVGTFGEAVEFVAEVSVGKR